MCAHAHVSLSLSRHKYWYWMDPSVLVRQGTALREPSGWDRCVWAGAVHLLERLNDYRDELNLLHEAEEVLPLPCICWPERSLCLQILPAHAWERERGHNNNSSSCAFFKQVQFFIPPCSFQSVLCPPSLSAWELWDDVFYFLQCKKYYIQTEKWWFLEPNSRVQ